MKKLFGVILIGLMFLGLSIESNAQSCPDVSGTWKRNLGADDLMMTITQTGCKIVSNHFRSGGFIHKLTGEWDKDLGVFVTKISRVNSNNSCQTVLDERMSKLNECQINLEGVSSDGKCELPTNWREGPFIWNAAN